MWIQTFVAAWIACGWFCMILAFTTALAPIPAHSTGKLNWFLLWFGSSLIIAGLLTLTYGILSSIVIDRIEKKYTLHIWHKLLMYV